MRLEDITDTQQKTRKMRNAIKHKKIPSTVKALAQDKTQSDKHHSGNRQVGGVDFFSQDAEMEGMD